MATNFNTYLEQLQAHGQYSFTFKDCVSKWHDVSKNALRMALLRQKHKGKITEPKRGLFLIIPPQYRRLECLPPDQCIKQIMEYLKLPYYVCLLSSAQMYGAAHQQPQVFQVMSNKNIANIHCGKVRIEFFKRKNMVNMPTKKFKTPRGMIKVATPETTALDLIYYQRKAGGINLVVNVLAELAESMVAEKLAQVITASHNLSDLQRLGYLLSFLNQDSLALIVKNHLKEFRVRPCPLIQSENIKNSVFNAEWKVHINAKLELEV